MSLEDTLLVHICRKASEFLKHSESTHAIAVARTLSKQFARNIVLLTRPEYLKQLSIVNYHLNSPGQI